MLVPSIFGESLFENDFFRKDKLAGLMRTDIKEVEGGYEIVTNLPGVRKEDIEISLKEGYLTITAKTSSEKSEKDSEDHYIHRERYEGMCTRNFYVGDQVKKEDIKAKFENGILTMTVPKDIPETKKETSVSIPIE